MFLENDYARPLVDFENGGPPKAFECLMSIRYKNSELHKILGRSEHHHCGKITRTERGMRMHLKTVHNWEEQLCLYSTDRPTEEEKNGNPRKLRMFTKENLEATIKRSSILATEQIATAQTEQLPLIGSEMSAEKLQKPTNEEK